MQKYPSSLKQEWLRQGEQSGRFVNTRVLGPQGFQASTSLAAEKRHTTGTPQAAAIWVGPESHPMKTRHFLIKAAIWRRDNFPTRLTAGLSIPSITSWAKL